MFLFFLPLFLQNNLFSPFSFHLARRCLIVCISVYWHAAPLFRPLPHVLTAACWVYAPASPWLQRQIWYPSARPAAGGCGPCRAGWPRTAPSGLQTPPSAAWRPWRAARCVRGTASASSWRRSAGTPRSLPPTRTDHETWSGQRYRRINGWMEDRQQNTSSGSGQDSVIGPEQTRWLKTETLNMLFQLKGSLGFNCEL